MKGRMCLIHWDHPQEMLAITKAKFPAGQKQGLGGSVQLEDFTGEQRTSPQKVH